jgi:hypothetical protein
MKNWLVKEFRDMVAFFKSFDRKVAFIFISVALITFISMYYSSPYFFRRYFDTEDDKFYSTIYWFSADGFLMLIIPLLLIKLFLKDKIVNYGFKWGDIRFGLNSSLLFIIVMLPVVWFISGSETFAKAYPQAGLRVKENFLVLIYYELFVGFYMLGWEFFWRGYMLFGLKEKFGIYAVFIQMIPFFILHRGKPELETFASIFAALILGYQAFRSGSFIYCFGVHWIVMLFVDIISVLRYKSQSYGIGFDSFIKLFTN